MDGEERPSTGSNEPGDLHRSRVEPEQVERYELYVKKAKQEATSGNLEKAIKFFVKASEIHPSDKIHRRIEKLKEALEELDLQEDADDDFVDVLNSGLTIYNELYNKLFEHQKEGVAFLYSLYRDGRKGGILADDMGLGKTIQVIGFLSGMFDSELIKYVLLVMPTTLISNWVKEFQKWTPGLRVAEFHGTSKKERTRNLEKIQRMSGIIITTYQMLINNWQQLATYNGREFEWDYIILDEAHKIKTSSTKTAKSCHSIPAKNRILLTGTPIQNNLREMWALYDFACQGTLLGTSKTFKMEYENPITRAREKDATPGEKALGLKISENLMKIIQPYFLRRTKSDVQNKKTERTRAQDTSQGPSMPSLTRKNDFIVWVYLSTIQEDVYRKFISLDQIKELLMTTRSPLAELNILKKLCDHPRLLSARACIQLGLEGDDYHSNEEGDHELVTKFDHLSDEILIEESGKLLLLIDLLHKLKEEGHRTLVFSQSRKMLDMIDRILQNKNFKVMRIDGTVALPEREKRISIFQSNNNYSVLLLTTQVGGVGLTLTAADRVVIFDPSWNPATDAQAVDRAYRIGQQENVVIYRLITCGTVEEKIYRRQIFKESLIRQTTGDKKNPFRYFSKQELKELFSLEDTRTSSTQIQLQNMHAAERKTDTRLDEHIAYLHTLQIFGISDHDLVYANELSSQEDNEYEDEHGQYIEQRVQKAHELVQMESQLNEQLMDQIRKSTEGAWVRQISTAPEKPKKTSLPREKQYSSPPVTVDLTEDDVGEVSCHMTSLIINDSSGEEDVDLPAAPFSIKPLNGNSHSGDTSHAAEKPLKLENSLQQSHEKIFDKQEEIIVSDSSVIETDDDRNTPSLKGDWSKPSPPVTEHISYSHPAEGEPIPIWHVEPEVCKKLRHSFGNRTEEFQQSCVTDTDMNDGLEASLSASKSHLPCDFNLVLDDSMERDECNASMEGLEGAMEISAAADKNAILVLEDSVENTSQRNGLEISMVSENGDMVVLDSSMANTSQRNVLGTSNKGAMLVLENSTEDISQEGNISETSMKLEQEKKNLNESMETADVHIKDCSKQDFKEYPLEGEEDEKSFHINEVSGTDNNELQASVHTDSEDELEYFVSKKKTARRIYSDSEGESSVQSLGRRRSIASRRSLVHVAVEEAADVNDTIVSSSSEESGEEEDEFVTSEAKEADEEESVEPEEEPAGETLPQEESIVQHSEDYESDSFVVKSSFDQEEDDCSSDESTGEDLLPGEQIDYLAQENVNIKGGVSLNEDPYVTLVNRGKQLKDAGKVKEALACFLEALDLKPGDPEIMMITLNLYRQQPQ
uniref:DNA excision repair protein ERCC-6-like n=1 Tax=Xenopus tropicalis TaxID=8364 RepID=A0A803KGC9_XENTR